MDYQLLKKRILAVLQVNTETLGMTANDLKQMLAGDYNRTHINRALSHLNKYGYVFAQEGTTPPKWIHYNARLDNNTTNEHTGPKIDLLIAVDLGHVHDCFHAIQDEREGTRVYAFADFAYDHTKQMIDDNDVSSSFSKDNEDCLYGNNFGTSWTSNDKRKRLFKCAINVRDGADMMLMNEIMRLVYNGELDKSAKICIVSKDRIFYTFCEMLKGMGYINAIVISGMLDLKDFI